MAELTGWLCRLVGYSLWLDVCSGWLCWLPGYTCWLAGCILRLGTFAGRLAEYACYAGWLCCTCWMSMLVLLTGNAGYIRWLCRLAMLAMRHGYGCYSSWQCCL